MIRTLALITLLAACKTKTDTGTTAAPPSAPATAPAPTGSVPAADPRVTAFWTWFSANAAALAADTDMQAVMLTISSEIEKIDPGIAAELGVDDGGRMLVITPNGNQKLFPLVEQLRAAAPSVPGWKIVAFRPRAKPGFGIKLGDKQLTAADLSFVAERAGAKLDITVFVPGEPTDQMKQIGFLLLDHTIGEHDTETKIGGIEFAAKSAAPPSAKPLTELAAAVDALP